MKYLPINMHAFIALYLIFNSIIFVAARSMPPSAVLGGSSVDYEDDYVYVEDQGGSSQATDGGAGSDEGESKRPKEAAPQPFFKKTNETVTALINQNVTLPCDANNLEGKVVIWYKDNNLISTGAQPVKTSDYIVNETTFALTIPNAQKHNEGDYLCEVEPQKVHKHIYLMVDQLAIAASSRSAQTLTRLPSMLLVTVAAFGCLFYARN